MEEIKSISEAFSMQPKFLEIVTEDDLSSCPWINPKESCKEIKLEQVIIGENTSTANAEMMYVGYNFDGKKLFQYLANTVNVHFQ